MEKANDKDQFIQLGTEEGKFKTLPIPQFTQRKAYQPLNLKVLTAFIPGVIKKIYTSKGKKVKKNDVLLTLDAMKMNNQIRAPFDGTIKEIPVKEGEKVDKNQVLVVLK